MPIQIYLLLCGLLLASPLSAQSREWLALLHYQGEGEDARSSMDSPAFFLSPKGQHAAADEYAESLRLMREASDQLPEGKDPRCQFPARALLLARSQVINPRHCPRFENWKLRFPLASLSLVFSTAYTGNAASMFGHNLLKLNLDRNRQKADALLDYGLGFMAASDPSDGPLYALKGLFGGYSGYFTLQPYYELVNLYAYAENRDLWELEIPMDFEERELFIAHLYELTEKASTAYYFTHVNCSSMLAEVLDAVKPDWHLRPALVGMVMPTELMRVVAERLDQQNLEFRPSQRRIWAMHLAELDARQMQVYRQSWEQKSLAVASADPLVLDSLLDRILIEKADTDLSEQQSLRAYEDHVLQARAFQSEISRKSPPRGENNPLRGHAPRLLGFEQSWRQDEAAIGLRLRWGWHDLLDPEAGFERNTQLNFFDLRWRRDETSDQHARLNIVEVWSLYPWTTDDQHWSWTLSGGAEAERIAADWETAGVMEGSTGLALNWGQELLAIMPGFRYAQSLEATTEHESLLRVNLLVLVRWHKHLRSLLRLMPSLHLESGRYVEHGEWETRGDIGRDWQLSLNLAKRDERSLALGLARTF